MNWNNITLLIITIIIAVSAWCLGESLSSIATAVGVVIAAWQIWEGRQLSAAKFEDSFDQQYRSLSYDIPVDALIGKSIKEDEEKKARESVYNYLDLCNEQIFQRHKKRISKDRWHEWKTGIKQNLDRVFFKKTWSEIKKEAGGTFSYLERLETEQYKIDPVKWKMHNKEINHE